MVWISMLVLGPLLAGFVIAGIWWLLRGRRLHLQGNRAGTSSFVAGVVVLLGGLAAQLIAGPLSFRVQFPSEFWEWYRDYQFTIPLILGALGLIILTFPILHRRGRGSAELAPRTPLRFAGKFWLLTPAVVLALILVATLTAGAASEPDSVTGRYTMYFVDLGGERGMGGTIYGWGYSIPCLILLAVMITIGTLNLLLIARPTLDQNRERDFLVRTLRTRNVLMLGTGALLWHLGLIFTSLAGTASLRGTFSTSEGSMGAWTSFAALEPILTAGSNIVVALGFALWLTVLLSGLPARRPVPATAQP